MIKLFQLVLSYQSLSRVESNHMLDIIAVHNLLGAGKETFSSSD